MNPIRTTRARVLAWLGGVALAVVVLGGAVYAVWPSSAAKAGPANTTAASSGVHTPTAHPGTHLRHRVGIALLRRIVHGELVIRTRSGYVTVSVQRGVVTGVDAGTRSLRVRSPDGFVATYTVGPRSHIHREHHRSTLSAVRAGDRVLLLAQRSRNHWVIRQLADRGPATARTATAA
jgi:hypothetical protein